MTDDLFAKLNKEIFDEELNTETKPFPNRALCDMCKRSFDTSKPHGSLDYHLKMLPEEIFKDQEKSELDVHTMFCTDCFTKLMIEMLMGGRSGNPFL